MGRRIEVAIEAPTAAKEVAASDVAPSLAEKSRRFTFKVLVVMTAWWNYHSTDWRS
jgi:hypothetical protein